MTLISFGIPIRYFLVLFLKTGVQVHPLNYQRDCTAIFGGLLKHDDSVNDRAKGSKLLKGESLTKKLWQAHFEQPFWRRGCMFRLVILSYIDP